MNRIDDEATTIMLMLVAWLSGIVLARGGWETASAIIFPPYAWYLFVEQVMKAIGWA